MLCRPAPGVALGLRLHGGSWEKLGGVMHLGSRTYARRVLLAAVAGFAACGVVKAQEQILEQAGSLVFTAQEQVEREAAERRFGIELARALALSLRDPAMRELVLTAMAQSPVKEDKLHFNSFIQGSGHALLAALSLHHGKSIAQMEELARQAGSLELYLPVEEHRSLWKGDENLWVATLYRDHEVPTGFDLNGEPVLLSADNPPATPTLILVPAEAFEADGTPLPRDLKSGPDSRNASADTSPQGSSYTGAWVSHVYIENSHESWGMGAPEFEMYLERVGNQRSKIRCAEAGSAAPFRWDMNGKEWTTPFLIAVDFETPSMEGLAMHFYEDDDTRCLIKDDKDYLKLTMDALVAAGGVYSAYQSADVPSGIIHFYNAATNILSIVRGNDDVVGIVSIETGQQLDETARRFLIKHSPDGSPNNSTMDKGTVVLQWTTRWR
jgi:hypothetical protein